MNTTEQIPEQRQRRVELARKAFKEFYAQCFWSYREDAEITEDKIPFVVSQLAKSRPELGLKQLDALGDSLREELARAPASPALAVLSPPIAALPTRPAPPPAALAAPPPAPLPSPSCPARPVTAAQRVAPQAEATVAVGGEPSEPASHKRRADVGHPSRGVDSATTARTATIRARSG